MTYFDPRIYNKQNLKKEDLKELEYWKDEFDSVIDNAKDNFEQEISTGISYVDECARQISEKFCEFLREALGYRMQDITVSTIDHYEEDVEEVEDPETFLVADDELDPEFPQNGCKPEHDAGERIFVPGFNINFHFKRTEEEKNVYEAYADGVMFGRFAINDDTANWTLIDPVGFQLYKKEKFIACIAAIKQFAKAHCCNYICTEDDDEIIAKVKPKVLLEAGFFMVNGRLMVAACKPEECDK